MRAELTVRQLQNARADRRRRDCPYSEDPTHWDSGRHCTRCGQWKPWGGFFSHPVGRAGRDPRCSTCKCTEQAQNPRFWEYQRRYQAENREERNRRRREAIARNPEVNREWVKQWRKKNPDKLRANSHRWRIRRDSRLRGVEHEEFDRDEIYERDGGRCHLCGRKVSQKCFDLDHIVPVSQGGPNIRRNIAISHPSCNRSRGAGRIPAQLRMFGEV